MTVGTVSMHQNPQTSINQILITPMPGENGEIPPNEGISHLNQFKP